MLGVGGAAIGGGLAGSAVESAASSASRQAVREDGMYAVGPRGQQHVLWSVDIDRRVAALTFDDGPTPVFTGPVLDVLRAAAVPATFFMIGMLVSQYPSIAQRGRRRRPRDRQPQLEPRRARRPCRTGRNVTEIDKATDVIASVTGATPQWYRPPRGMLVGAAVRRAFERGQGGGHVVGHAGAGRIADGDVAGVRRHLVESIHPGAVIDLHDGVGASAFGGVDGYSASLIRRREAEIAALPAVIDAWKAAGYRWSPSRSCRPSSFRPGDQVPRVEAAARPGAHGDPCDHRRPHRRSTSSPARRASPRRGGPPAPSSRRSTAARYAEVLRPDLRGHRADGGAPGRAGRRRRPPSPPCDRRPGYVTEVFCRTARYFQPANGERIDAIRDRHRRPTTPTRGWSRCC